MNELPEYCLVFCPGRAPGHRIARVRRGETGYWPVSELPDATDTEALQSVRKANADLGLDGVQVHCMKMGSLFGFDTNGSDPKWVRDHCPKIDPADASGEGVRHVS